MAVPPFDPHWKQEIQGQIIIKMIFTFDQNVQRNGTDLMRVEEWLAKIGTAIRFYVNHDDLIY